MSDLDHLHERVLHLEEKRLERIEKTLEEVMENQRQMEKQLERYSARWGLVLMVGSALIAAVKLFWADAMKIIK